MKSKFIFFVICKRIFSRSSVRPVLTWTPHRLLIPLWAAYWRCGDKLSSLRHLAYSKLVIKILECTLALYYINQQLSVNSFPASQLFPPSRPGFFSA